MHSPKAEALFLVPGSESAQGRSKGALSVTAAGCLTEGVDGKSKCACPVMTAGPERDESLTYHFMT